MTSCARGGGGVSQKLTKSIFYLIRNCCYVVRNLTWGRGGVSHKLTKPDKGGGGVEKRPILTDVIYGRSLTPQSQTWVLSFFSGYYFPININLCKRIFYHILYPGNSRDISPIPILYPKTGYISR